jgi:hypothetical protein
MCSSGIRKSNDRDRSQRRLTAAVVLVIATLGSDGSLVPLAAAPPSASGFRVSGIVREAGTMRLLPGARIVVTSGANAGTSVVSDAGGTFTLLNLAAGVVDLQGMKDGYLVARVQAVDVSQNTTLDIRFYPTPPRDARGAVARARCNDSSWSWVETPALACTNNGGIATAYVRAHATPR